MRAVYTCSYCSSQSTASIDFAGDMPVGTLIMCDCPQARKSFESSHRAEIERRKNAARGGSLSKSILRTDVKPKKRVNYGR